MTGRRIIESLKEALSIARGELPKEAYRAHIPARVEARDIRQKLGLSQAAFASRFGLSLYTLRNWEQGRRRPDPTARAYLTVIDQAPELVYKALGSPAPARASGAAPALAADDKA